MPSSLGGALNPSDVLSIIMGGGRGTRLFPLTRDRSKPAVPFGGKYRLVDIPISNCISSGLKRIYILTQFNSASLHRHIAQSYNFDHFSAGFVEVLAAEQTFTSTTWYQGTADAVRKNLGHFLNHRFKYAMILSGDQLYRMDYRQILAAHLESSADLTIATVPVSADQASSFGIMQVTPAKRISRFVEKPSDRAVLETLRLPPGSLAANYPDHHQEVYLASSGIYVFNRDTLIQLLDNKLEDFGKHIIPKAIETHRVYSHVFQGYWEDIGTIRSFFEANLNLVDELPRFNFFDMSAPIFTRPRFLPGSKINGAAIDHAVISDGCIINHADISRSIVGVRSIVERGARLHRALLLGTDFYESADSIAENERAGRPRMGIGSNTVIENAIVDKNARIGNDCVVTPAGKPENVDHPLYFIRDGIVIVPRYGCIPHGTVI